MIRRQNRRNRASRVAAFSSAHVVETLEQKRLLSGTNSVDTEQAEIDPALTEWRNNAFNTIREQADEAFADQFGAETELYTWGYSEWALRVDSAAQAQLEADGIQFSSTNVQVAGVDEGDIVETDGDYIYTLTRDGDLAIIRTATATEDSAVVSRISIAQSPSAMFLHEGRLTIISSPTHVDYRLLDISAFTPTPTRTTVTILDVTVPDSPSMVQETVVDGSFQSARAIDGQVYVVVGNSQGIPYLPRLNTLADESFDTGYRYETRDEYLGRMAIYVHGSREEGNEKDGLTPPSVYQRSIDDDGNEDLQRLGWLKGAFDESQNMNDQLASVLRFDSTASAIGPADSISIRNSRHSNSLIYASANAIYLIDREYQQVGQDSIFFIPSDSTASSRIHKIDISSDTMSLDGSGIVPGTIESQFSVDEHNGYLRLVTTTGDLWEATSRNHLFILEDQGDELVEVGSITDLAPGERIYSARFNGDRGWMVTFRQVDPVYSFDLSDPTDPKVTGELKITGYSEYLQQIGDNLLLAIGRNADQNGVPMETQVSLFDVSDPEKPTLLDRYSLDGGRQGNSEALYHHMAFNYLPTEQLLVIPFNDSTTSGQGLTLLNIDATDGISEFGEVAPTTGTNFRRSIQIDNLLYAVAPGRIALVEIGESLPVQQEIDLLSNEVPVEQIDDLLHDLQTQVGNTLELRRYENSDGFNKLRVEIAEVLGNTRPEGDEDRQYDFRVIDPESGAAVLRQMSDAPWVELRTEITSQLQDGTYEFQVRTRNQRLEKPDWSSWTPSEAFTIGSDATELLTDAAVRFADTKIRWSDIADRVTTIENDDGSAGYVTNAVDHYEVWLSDAIQRETIEWHRDVATTELNLNDLSPGQFWVWFRPVFEDGTLGEWSKRQEFGILGQKPEILNSVGTTANTLPRIEWEDFADANTFEIEVTAPDGEQTLYSADNLIDAHYQFSEELAAGTYSFRVRGELSEDVFTEWSDAVEFTIVGRPTVTIDGQDISWDTYEGAIHELWISISGTTEPLFHEKDLTASAVTAALESLNLEDHDQYDVWVRSYLPDGTRTTWSPKASLRSFADTIQVDAVSKFLLNQAQTLSWQAADGVESFEIFVQKAGESGAAYRQTEITDLSHTIANQLAKGNYKYWVRGLTANGNLTKWGDAYPLTITDSPEVVITNERVSWLPAEDASRYEVWINRVDSNNQVLESRVTHVTDLIADNLDISHLPDGDYSIWVRSIREDADDIIKSDWSQRTNVTVATAEETVDDLIGSLVDEVDEFLDVLDVF